MRQSTSRNLLIFILFLAVIIGSGPYLTGMLVQTKFQDVVKVLSSIDSMPVTITVMDYHRGWFHSSAKTSVTLVTNKSGSREKYTVYLEHIIRHGPLVQMSKGNYVDWRLARGLIHSKLLLTEEAKKILISELGETELFNIKSIFSLTGAVTMKLEGKTLKLREHEGTGRVAFQGVKGEWHLSRDMKHLKGEMVLPGIDFDINGVHLFAKDLVYKTELSKSPTGLWPGKFTTNMSEVKLGSEQAKVALSAQGVTTSGAMDIDGNMVDFLGSATIEKIILNDKQYGPVTYVNSLKHIESKVVKSLFDLNQKMKMVGSQQSVYIQYLLALVPDFLKSRPEFSIDQLQIHTNQGDINGLLTFAVGGPDAFDINNMKPVINSIAAKADLSLPKVIFKEMLTSLYTKNAIAENEIAKHHLQAPNTAQPAKVFTEEEIAEQVEIKVTDSINRWLKENTLIEKDQNYVLSFELNQGKFTVNGQPVEFQQAAGLPKPGAPTLPPSPISPHNPPSPIKPGSSAPQTPDEPVLPKDPPTSGRPAMPRTPAGPKTPTNPVVPSGDPKFIQ